MPWERIEEWIATHVLNRAVGRATLFHAALLFVNAGLGRYHRREAEPASALVRESALTGKQLFFSGRVNHEGQVHRCRGARRADLRGGDILNPGTAARGRSPDYKQRW